MDKRLRFTVTAATIAALYAVVTIMFPFAYGPVQFRFSEILTVLPYFTPAAIPERKGYIYAN
jgi:uncharacterized membrane protein